MLDFSIKRIGFSFFTKLLLLMSLLVSCGKPFVKKAPKDKFYLYKNNIEVTEGNFTKSQKTNLIQKSFSQLDDSAKVNISQNFFFNVIKHPFVYDSAISRNSADNMEASLFHSGYYNAEIKIKRDTIGKKIIVHYQINAGKPTLIDTLNYTFKIKELQIIGENIKKNTSLQKNAPITKIGVLSEVNRIVEGFRNNGYYKFTASELKVLGDTAIDALTSLSDDPFEQLRSIALAQEMRDNPKIKINIVLNPPLDSSKLKKYRINKIFIYPDFRINAVSVLIPFNKIDAKGYQFIQFNKSFNYSLFEKLITFKSGDIFKQSEYYNTIANISKTGAWQSINIQIEEIKNCDSLINLIVQLIPTRKYSFETALEMSYSASNSANILAGNLFGLSGNISIINKNLAKEAISMKHNIRAGIEFNNNSGGNSNFINSNEISYTNTTSFPRLLFPFIPNAFNKKSQYNKGETYINAGTNYITRFNLFKLQSTNTSFGWTGVNKKTWRWNWNFLNIGYSDLFNKTDSFSAILADNPFLRFSYNTALVTGMGLSFYKVNSNLNHPNSLSKENSYRFNIEESGLSWGLIPVLNKNKRRYIKGDVEIKHSVKYNKTTIALRSFIGIGIPLLGTDTNRTLPFFKQYYGGGSNSMRAWPVRGIGPGGNALIPFSSNRTIFNDRTGDVQIELNAEYRYDIARIIPNTLTLRGAIFTDIGNVWNFKNTKLDGSADTSQIQWKNIYKQLGVTAGTGFRLDFNYFIVRLDLGFRIKKPDLFYINDGWSTPSVGFDDILKKIFTRGNDDEYRKWRYENFNFTIGLSYPF